MTRDTPRALGYSMPAEWEPHEATWMAWPHDPLTWVNGVEAAEDAYVEMIKALTPRERVELLVRDEPMGHRVAGRLRKEGITNHRLHRFDYADSWTRDTAPTFVVNRATRAIGGVDWRFNAWGRKYETHLRDDAIALHVLQRTGIRPFASELVLEGGGIEVNGRGTLLVTEQCQLNPNRNPGLGKPEMERALGDFLGVANVVWLAGGIEGDDTDGHIDDVARFTSPTTVVTAVEPRASDPNHGVLAENLRRLRGARDERGQPFTVVELPMPRALVDGDLRAPASYANFYIGNAAVLLPTFDDPNDDRAAAILAKLFPDRRIARIPSTDLVCGMGACHCLTQQQPSLRSG